MTSSSTNTPDIPAALAPRDRFAGLSGIAIDRLRRTHELLQTGDIASAAAALAGAQALTPLHSEVRRMQAVLANHAGRFADARTLLQGLLKASPDDPLLLNDVADALFGLNELDAAFDATRRVTELRPDSASAWFTLGQRLMDYAWTAEAMPALARAVALAPDDAHARTLYADVMVLLGHFGPAREQYLEVLRRAPGTGPAWWGLANIKTVRLSDDEIRLLEALLRDPAVRESDRLAMGCVLGKAYEDHRRYPEAFGVLTETNARISLRKPWDAAQFSRLVDTTMAEFERPHARAADPTLGDEVIFIVSLPRSGSTLTEQMLAAHPQVEGASELGEVSRVLQEESVRRGKDFPFWIADATADDWARIGRNYLAGTARWRVTRPRSTDKMPNNWYFIGAIQAMLPGARIVNCRRDPVETCWSCFKQMFSIGNEFSYRLDYLARFWHDYDTMMRRWHARTPGDIREQSYEAMVADPESELRALLDYCRLPFDAACLRYYDVERSVRTASAAQVREPLRRNTARSAGYGTLLDPLRAALAGPRLP